MHFRIKAAKLLGRTTLSAFLGGPVTRSSLGKLGLGLADGLNAFFLVVYALLLGPLGILKGPLLLERAFFYVLAMAPRGQLSRFVRAAIDWRLGNFDSAISDVQGLILVLEDSLSRGARPGHRRVLEDLYTLVTRAYLHIGRIDDAMLMVIRAKKSLGIERLPGLAELNAKTAHLVRAGLSAGRLLDGGGLATLFVKTPPAATSATPKQPPIRQGATAKPPAAIQAPAQDTVTGAKVIQFPLPRPAPETPQQI